jgi:transcriptional regulator with XRE-family HTH domain
MKIGEVIRSWRQKRDLGVREVAQIIGISHGTVSRIERGEQIDATTMIKLLRWLFERPTTNGTQGKRRADK